MRSGLLTNSATAAAKVVANPNALPNAVAQSVAAGAHIQGENLKADGVLARERGVQAPERRTEGTFDDSASDPDREGAVPESLEGHRMKASRKLLAVA
ncbi:MAG: hypothetical protein KDD60_10145 [Bdellovibrionales bacterium]|nr:hypothetical protein [Bdellovibrionales bacterium]